MMTQTVKVKKYGGTSVGSVEFIRRVAQNLVSEHQRGIPQLVVVSAMAKTTDQLISMALQVTKRPRARELDMLLTTGEQVAIALLAMAVHELGANAIPLTGAQCGILTDGNFSRARIQNIATDKIHTLLDEGNIVIVAGFQGVTSDHEITTLGRGGSDTTATALAAAMKSPVCELYTDVDGVFTADPRLVSDAHLLQFISYEEMLEYAASGSEILHPRCVELAKKFDIPLEVRSSLHNRPGTTIIREEILEKVAITGVTGDDQIARVALTQVEDVPGVAAKIAQCLADAGIDIRLIIQGIRHDQTNDFSLIISEQDAKRSQELLQEIAQKVGAQEVKVNTNVAKVSVIGSGIASTPGVAAAMFKALANQEINIELISSSEVRIACIIQQDKLDSAIQAIHKEFNLGRLQRNKISQVAQPHTTPVAS
ncbi:aspartate kinase [Acidobacteria bacterium AH-259-D05]|nr:aspartate kinase [Acidobacteria bacterium AH-259-D05]